jgi:hypothetical protein
MKKNIQETPYFPIVLPNDYEDPFDETVEETDEIVTTDDFVAEEQEEQEEVQESTEEIQESTEDDAIVSYLNMMKELGYIQAEEEITLENAEQIIEANEQVKRQEALETVIESLPQNLKEIVLYGLKGGQDLEDFMELQMKEKSLNYDMNNEEDQKKIVARYLKSKGNDDFVIETVIERLEDTEKLKAEAKLRYSQMKAAYESEKAQKMQEQEMLLEDRQKEIKKFQNEVFSTIKEKQWAENSKKEIIDLIYGNDKNTPPLQSILDSIVSTPKLLVDFARIVKQYYDPKEGFKLDVKPETVIKNEFKKKLASSISKSGISKATTTSNKNLDWRNIDIAF